MLVPYVLVKLVTSNKIEHVNTFEVHSSLSTAHSHFSITAICQPSLELLTLRT